MKTHGLVCADENALCSEVGRCSCVCEAECYVQICSNLPIPPLPHTSLKHGKDRKNFAYLFFVNMFIVTDNTKFTSLIRLEQLSPNRRHVYVTVRRA
jgi:hypothetical protein